MSSRDASSHGHICVHVWESAPKKRVKQVTSRNQNAQKPQQGPEKKTETEREPDGYHGHQTNSTADGAHTCGQG
jgi:hypothetical protein